MQCNWMLERCADHAYRMWENVYYMQTGKRMLIESISRMGWYGFWYRLCEPWVPGSSYFSERIPQIILFLSLRWCHTYFLFSVNDIRYHPVSEHPCTVQKRSGYRTPALSLCMVFFWKIINRSFVSEKEHNPKRSPHPLYLDLPDIRYLISYVTTGYWTEIKAARNYVPVVSRSSYHSIPVQNRK